MAKQRYKIIGKHGADLGPDENGYTLRRAREEGEEWMETAADPTVLVVPLDGPNRSTDPGAKKYRDTKVNRDIRAQFTDKFLRGE